MLIDSTCIIIISIIILIHFLFVLLDDVKNKLNFLGLENKNDMYVFYLEIENLPRF